MCFAVQACVCASMVASEPAVSGGQIYFSSDEPASAGSAYADAHDQLSLIESEEQEHELRAAAAQLQAQAEAAAMMAPHSDALIESMAPGMAGHSAAAAPSEAEAAQAALDGDSLSPEQAALLEAAASAPADEEERRMTSVMHLEQFEDFAGDDQALVDSESEVRARVDARINAQVEAEMRAYANSRGQAEAESASHAELSQAMQSAAVQAHAAAADAELDAQAEADLSEEEHEERQNRAAQQAALSLEASFTSEMEYPQFALVESASTARSTGLVAAEAEAESSVEPSNLPSGVAHTKERALGMQKLRSRIAAAAASAKDQAVPARGHSFIASKSATHTRSRAKGGDQWWLEKAPWFLPPPPEWGPMPVTMYTSYFHRPTASAQHLDYAHGIPLPHAEALSVARRTYPQPPFEAQQEAEVAFMEVASEQHAETGADAEAEVEAEAETETETELDAESDSESEVDAESESESDAEVDAESESEVDADSESEVEVELEDFDPSFMELASDAETEADAEAETETEAHAEAEAETEVAADAETEAEAEAAAEAETAVEAEAVDDLAHASPLSGEEYFSAPM